MNSVKSSLLLLACSLCQASPTQPLQSLQDTAHAFVSSSLSGNGRYEIGSVPIDDRLQLAACDQSLTAFAQSGAVKPGRNTIGIRCDGSKRWTIYSTVIVKAFEQVLVVGKALNRNEIIKAEHLTRVKIDVATLPQGYITNPGEVLNKQAARSVAAGTALNRNHYIEPDLIKRGDRVRIQTGKPGLLITSKGVAMAGGVKGQRIRVKNLTSKKVIQATVEKPGLVTVYF